MKKIIGLAVIVLALTGCGEDHAEKKEIFNAEDTSDVYIFENVKINYEYECSSKGGNIIIDIIEKNTDKVKFNAICIEK
jgi:hypothetical protein